MKYIIVPKTEYKSEPIKANNPDDALANFAAIMDTDMHAYFDAIELPEKTDGSTVQTNAVKTLCVTATPYATQYGTIDVPEDLPEDEYEEYVHNHFGDIKFGEADLDYAGTDLDISE